MNELIEPVFRALVNKKGGNTIMGQGSSAHSIVYDMLPMLAPYHPNDFISKSYVHIGHMFIIKITISDAM